MSEAKKPSCSECFWFDHNHKSLDAIDARFGYCRKDAPIPLLVEKHYFGLWPLVDDHDFCGNFSVSGEK